MSVQGKEADYVLLVLCKKDPGLYKHQLDYRVMNVAISRAKKTLDISYLEDSLQLNPTKKDEDNTKMLKFGELYSLEKILKKQKK